MMRSITNKLNGERKEMTFKSGFVAILGRPNVGKSTFLNHVMGQKIAIMSDKAQTTRNKIMGIYTTETEQIVFIDTPGIHKPKTALVVLYVKLKQFFSWFLPMKSEAKAMI